MQRSSSGPSPRAPGTETSRPPRPLSRRRPALIGRSRAFEGRVGLQPLFGVDLEFVQGAQVLRPDGTQVAMLDAGAGKAKKA